MVYKMSTSCHFQFVGSARKFFLIFGESLTFCMSLLSRHKGQEKKSTQKIRVMRNHVQTCSSHLQRFVFFAYAHDAKTSKAAMWCCSHKKKSHQRTQHVLLPSLAASSSFQIKGNSVGSCFCAMQAEGTEIPPGTLKNRFCTAKVALRG